MTAALSLAATAAEVGLSSERFRKVWRGWMADLGFPPPIRAPGVNARGSYAWRAESVEAWKQARESALGKGASAPLPPANDPGPRARPLHTVDRQRQAVLKLMGA